MEYLTITAISQQLKIPDSTLRYYANKHGEYLRSTGEGRKRRYHSDSIEVLRYIAEAYNNRKTASDINSELEQKYSRIIEQAIEPQHNNATTQQPDNTALQAAIMNISSSLTIIATQQQEINDLKERLEKLEQIIATTQQPRQGFLQRIFSTSKKD